MALIKCPECGREVSDKASSCPSCGCPLKTTETIISEHTTSVETQTKKNDGNIKKILPIIVGIVAVAIIGIVLYNVKVVQPKKIEAQNKATYEEAVGLIEKGKYEEAIDLLERINGYKDVLDIREELKYESCAYSAVNAVKEILKNPDSISVYDVKFYNGREGSKEDEDEDEDTDTEESDTVIDADHPYIIIHLGAQNGFGGNTESYASCIYDKNNGEYKLDSYTNELDTDELDKDSDNYFMYLLGATLINGYYDDGIEVGKIDMGRFKTLLKNDAYSAIKIIE